jgi:hypothetical protein
VSVQLGEGSGGAGCREQGAEGDVLQVAGGVGGGAGVVGIVGGGGVVVTVKLDKNKVSSDMRF